MSILIQELANYKTEKDYDWLAKEMKIQSIICIVDYQFSHDEESFVFRDVGKTVYFEKNGNATYQICGRGISYLTAFSEEDFIKLCEILHVEIVKP